MRRPILLLIPLLTGASLFAKEAPAPTGPERHRPAWPTPGQAGPVLGAPGADSMVVWFRPSEGVDAVRLRYGAGDAMDRDAGAQTPDAESDRCLRWTLDGLSPGESIRYRIEDAADGRVLSGPHAFRLPPPSGPVPLVIGSCADESDAVGRLWRTVAARRPGAVLLIGDTPYIDRTDLAWQRLRHRDFLCAPGLRDLLPTVPLYSVWDDHDMGANDCDGSLPGKATSLAAFKEYRVNPAYGDGKAGLYHRFSSGLMDVFVLDTRYFAGREKNPDHLDAVSLLGVAQWRWLTDGLKNSTRPFKVLACGMIWHDWKNAGKKDTWQSHEAERAALFRFLGEHRIGGVILVGGDVHQSALLRMPTRELAGYDIAVATISPLSSKVSKGAGMPGPEEGLIRSIQEPFLFLSLSAEQAASGDPEAVFTFITGDDRVIFEAKEPLARLTPPPARTP